MAKKEEVTFVAVLRKNEVKGGAWLAQVDVLTEEIEELPLYSRSNAFSNASAGKRWIKEQVAIATPRKSVKMVPVETRLKVAEDGTRAVVPYVDAKGKFLEFKGLLKFKTVVERRDEEYI
jgi:hypothetical protein